MKLDTRQGEVEIVNEPTYTFRSMDNTRKYQVEVDLARDGYMSSVHGVLLNGEPLVVIGAGGGASGVHPHSAIAIDDQIYVAVGDSVVCLSLAPLQIVWSTQVDSATCFGVHYQRERSALLTHGELEIARIDGAGKIVWRASGADIFSEGFNLERDAAMAVDFNGDVYRFDYETGDLLV